MTGRRGNNSNRFGNQKKPTMQNQNRNRLSGGKTNNFSGGGLMNQVSPWLSQSNSGSSFNSLGRNIVNDPQAQLALASNLLNNLLSPSQLNKLSQPPSLLSLGNMSNSGSSYGGNQSYNRDRYGSGRQHSGKVQKRDDYKNKDFKNKRFGNDRKNAGLKKPDQSNKKSAGDEKNVQEKKDTAIGTATSSVTNSTVSTTDNKEEIKVDNTDKLDQSVSVNEAKKEDKVVENDKKVEPAKKDSGSKKDDSAKKPEEPKVSYSEIPPALLFCHICRKHMWDDTSFEKHLEGRPHKMMVEELDQSYKLKVDLLRHDMRVTEQQRENDIQRAQRKGKSNVKSQQRGFCTMCNLSFLGMLPAHRKNEKHQKLKKFLHPKCSVCSKEFYTRLEWDDHKLTPAHLKKLAEIRKDRRPDLQDSEFDIADFIEDVNDEIEAEGVDIKVTGKRETMEELSTETKEGAGEEGSGDAVAASADGEGEENADENDKEGKADEDEETKKLPKYNPGIPVGENFVVGKTGHLCRACNRFMLTTEDIKIHCQTIIHYNNIVKILKAQNKIVRKRKLNESTTKVSIDEKPSDGKTPEVVQEENVKRIKLEEDPPSEVELNESTNKSMEVDPQPAPEANNKGGSEKYDPENPDSENENEKEDDADQQLKLNHDIKETKVVLEDIKKEVQAEEPVVKEEPITPSKPERKPPGRATGRGPRARRARR